MIGRWPVGDVEAGTDVERSVDNAEVEAEAERLTVEPPVGDVGLVVADHRIDAAALVELGEAEFVRQLGQQRLSLNYLWHLSQLTCWNLDRFQNQYHNNYFQLISLVLDICIFQNFLLQI